MASLRSRLYVYLLIAIVPLLAATGLATGLAFTAWMERQFDRTLEAKARALVTLTEQESGVIDFDFADEFMPEFEISASPQYFEVWLDDGTLFERSRSFKAHATVGGAGLKKEAARLETPRFRNIRLPDGRQGRQIQIDFVPKFGDEDEAGDAADEPRREQRPTDASPGPAAVTAQQEPVVTLVVARERESLDGQIRLVYIWFGCAALVLLAAIATLTRLLLRSALRPLDNLVAQVRALDADSLGSRIRIPLVPDEIAPVVEQLNALLARVETAFARERQLSSDIAHELKTPVAELRNLCEVARRWPEDPDGVREFFGDARNIALHMDRLVTQLLLLARYEEGRQQLRFGPVAVAEVIDAAWRPLADAAKNKSIVLHNEVPESLRLETDPDLFMLMVTNLLSNAVTHGVVGSPVLCGSTHTGSRLSICIANQSDDLEADDLAAMFDRFWRKDDARSGGHNVGLGLSLVRVFAGLLDLAIEPGLDADGIVRICLVRAAAADELTDTADSHPRGGVDPAAAS